MATPSRPISHRDGADMAYAAALAAIRTARLNLKAPHIPSGEKTVARARPLGGALTPTATLEAVIRWDLKRLRHRQYAGTPRDWSSGAVQRRHANQRVSASKEGVINGR